MSSCAGQRPADGLTGRRLGKVREPAKIEAGRDAIGAHVAIPRAQQGQGLGQFRLD